MDGNSEVPSSQAGAGGSGGRRPRRQEGSSSSSGNQRQMRLFGNEIAALEDGVIAEEETTPSSPLTIRNHYQRYLENVVTKKVPSSEIIRDWTLDQFIGELLENPNGPVSMLDSMKLQSMVKGLQKYNFRVLDPSNTTISKSTSNLWNGRSRCCYVGHPQNESHFRAWIDRKWPPNPQLTVEQARDRCNAEWTLHRSLQAMKYLRGHEDRAIYHHPSKSIYLAPGMDLNKVDEVIERYNQAKLPRLVYTDRMHFKTSGEKKAQHRQVSGHPDGGSGNGRGMQEETSSEEEI